MSKARRPNLFTMLLIPAGLVFVVTAIAYGYMAFVAVNAQPGDAARNAAHPLFQWLRHHGDAALIGELIVLALITVGVIATDKADAYASESSTRMSANGDDEAIRMSKSGQ